VKQQATLRKEQFEGAQVAPLVVMALLLTSILIAPLWAAAAPADEPAKAAEQKAEAEPTAEAEAIDLAEQWGIEVTSIRLTANDHMIDYRYKVLDADKATDLFKRQIKPHLIHQETGKVLAVPETAKLGPLRNSNIPQEGKIYWMFFGNGGDLVQTGDKVTVVIGDFRVENLVVE
jgi:hypothetical protein